MAVLSWVLYVLTRYRFFFLPVFLLGALALFAMAANRRGGPAKTRAALPLGVVAVLVAAFGVGNLIWGPEVNGTFLHRYGIQATALVTSVRATNNFYNEQRVRRHSIVFRTPEGQSVTGAFDDDDFNLHPVYGDQYSYPGEGEAFTIRFLPSALANFVIVTDDDSPYAVRVRCSRLAGPLNEAKRQYQFDPGNHKFRVSYAERLRAMLDQGCESHPEERLRAEQLLSDLERK